ncbi:hypothetical protein INF37_04535 [Pseudoflavonifractor sp. DSM 107456]|uniref:Uncharacterized protein n=1 Tax=Pseudoflavonifractor gallinarum TaxID=2779352 RepID=A0ABR9R991_9FIRM|nr:MULTISPECIES: hypothetical protein [Eubacteriales]MBE5055264.1 hypothetical protein [Pseudoflavonifractor gallinarum]
MFEPCILDTEWSVIQRDAAAERERREAAGKYRSRNRQRRRAARLRRKVYACIGGLLLLTVLATMGLYVWR